MKFIDMVNIEEYEKKKDEIKSFIDKNKRNYNILEYSYYKVFIDYNQIYTIDSADISPSIERLLSMFGIMKSDFDTAKYFANLLETHGFLDTNCCEVASGVHSVLSKIVEPTISKNLKSFCIYEPTMMDEKIGNAKLYKQKFNKEVDTYNIDTIFGMRPCKATIDMVELAIEKDKNLLLSFCGCDISTEKYPIGTYKKWYNSFLTILLKRYPRNFKILYFPTRFDHPNPIMIRYSEEHKRKGFKL